MRSELAVTQGDALGCLRAPLRGILLGYDLRNQLLIRITELLTKRIWILKCLGVGYQRLVVAFSIPDASRASICICSVTSNSVINNPVI